MVDRLDTDSAVVPVMTYALKITATAPSNPEFPTNQPSRRNNNAPRVVSNTGRVTPAKVSKVGIASADEELFMPVH